VFERFFKRNSHRPAATAPAGSSATDAVASPPLAQAGDIPPGAPGKDAMIRMWDEFGRERMIRKEDWRRSILPGAVRQGWNDPDALYALILVALDADLSSDIVPAAEQLRQLEPGSPRAACALAIVHLRLRRIGDARAVLQGYTERHGEDAAVLTNLAKVQAEEGDEPASTRTLWRALELDPNLDNALLWHAAIAREQQGASGQQEAFEKIAALPGSWRAELWLARADLARGDLAQAIARHRHALAKAGEPAPPDLLFQISGDLGNAGRLQDLLELVSPRYSAARDGLRVGNNLIKASIELGRLDDARRLIDELYALKRQDWRETLSYWETALAQARIAAQPPVADPPDIRLFAIEGPVWLDRNAPIATLFPKPAEAAAPSVVIVGSVCARRDAPTAITAELTDAAGRLSRAAPLFIAEQFEMLTTARAQTLVPWTVSGGHGFVVFGTPWTDQELIDRTPPCDVLIALDLFQDAAGWTLVLRALRKSDGATLSGETRSFTLETAGAVLSTCTDALVQALGALGVITRLAAPPSYDVPRPPWLNHYLVSLEQLLALRCARMEGTPATFLNGEREILEGNLRVCVEVPESACVRLCLARTVMSLKGLRPALLAEFHERIRALVERHPLRGEAARIDDALVEALQSGS
jgi:tetratricopeptide (TPR) repeat protein